VEIFFECQGVSPRRLSSQVLTYEGTGRAYVGLTVRLDTPFKERPMFNQAHVVVKNESPVDLEDVRVRILFPESAGIELTEYDAGVARLAAGESTELLLGLKVLSQTDPLPLHFRVTAKDFGRLASWAADLHRDGDSVSLSAPRISISDAAPGANTGPRVIAVRISDDSQVEHVEFWFKDEKVAYAVGPGSTLEMEVPVEIELGENRFTVRAYDDQRLLRRSTWVVRGFSDTDAPTTDAGEP